MIPMTEEEYLATWNIHEQNRRAEFMNHMYDRSGRTNGLYTGLWQQFCMEEAGPYCKKNLAKMVHVHNLLFLTSTINDY